MTTWAEAIEEHIAPQLEVIAQIFRDGDVVKGRKFLDALARELKPVGTCPMCGHEVFNVLEEDGPVWICPRDLDPDDKIQRLYWRGSDVTEEQMEKDGVYSLCYEDHGGYCDDHMPMHSACYDGMFTSPKAGRS